MRKILNVILAILSVLYLALVVLFGVNAQVGFMDKIGDAKLVLEKIMAYAPPVLLGGFAFTNLFGKGFLRILFFVIFVIVAVCYIIVMFFPEVITKIFGA